MPEFINLFDEINESEINYINASEKIEGNFWLDMVKNKDFFVKYLKNEDCMIRFLYLSDSRTRKNERGIRKIEYYENFLNINEILKKNIDLYDIGKKNGISEGEIFFIIVLRNNYKILKEHFNNEIPETKFAIIKSDFFQGLKFSIVQKTINGVNLWDLYYNFEDKFVRKHPFIREKLKKYLKNKYIDLNIKNFIITNENDIFYVDIKPTYISSKKLNDHNRVQFKKYLLNLVYKKRTSLV